jgi:hypothetical protein
MVDIDLDAVDAALDEEAGEDITILLRGKEYTLPGRVEAKVVVQVLRLMDSTGQVHPEVVPDFWATLIGEERLTEMLDDGMTWTQLQALQTELLSRWGIIGDDEEGDDPNPQ